MATPSQPLRRKSSANFKPEQDDGGLTQSLSNLSLNQNKNASSPLHRGNPPTPLNTSTARRSSPSPHRGASVRNREPESGGSNGSGNSGGGGGGGTLLRKASMNSLHSANGVAPPKGGPRRPSYGQVLSPSSPTATFSIPAVIERPPATPTSVARSYFESELQILHESGATPSTNAIVILNDAVYGHRFSRPRTSRSALATIVERPERVRAAVLGLSMAYVRLGERHAEGAVAPHPDRDVYGLKSVPFRIQKTSRKMPLSSPAVTNVHGAKWMEELTIMCNSAETKLAMGGKELQRPEMNRGDQGAPAKLHEGDLYLCSESLDAMEGAMGAVCEAVDVVFGAGPRTAFVGIRPPGHHCSASYPSGFCWVNNVHVGIMHGILNHGLTHAAIIDFDLHHGDGSQAITWQHNTRAVTAHKNAPAWKKTSIGYFSLHDINSYPCEGGDEEKVKNASLCIDNAHGQTIWNVHLQSWKSEKEFWDLYENHYNVILEKTRKYLKDQAIKVRAAGQIPKAAIFFSAGFDASEWESAGMQRHQVNVPTEFYARLGEDVVGIAAEEGLEVDGRVISVLEGGYSDRALASGVCSHMSGLVGKRASKSEVPSTAQTVDAAICTPEPKIAYDPAWWSSAELDKLEDQVVMPPTPPKQPRHTVAPTYSSPTQASTAKIAEPIKIRRSFSNMSQNGGPAAVPSAPRLPTPPPPEVPWHIAARELSNILIPSDRQTQSCRPEDLNAEASKARRDRQTQLLGITLPAPPAPADQQPTRMALRGRKPKPFGSIDEEDSSRPGSRASVTDSLPSSPRKRNATPSKAGASTPARRGQGAHRATPSKPPAARPAPPARRASRRLSGASVGLSPMKESAEQDAAVTEPSLTSPTEEANFVPSVSGESQSVERKVKPASTGGKGGAGRGSRGGKKAIAASGLHGTPVDRPRPGTVRSNNSGDGLEHITTGMKKVKINLITPAQREAREQAKRRTSSTSAVATPIEERPPPDRASFSSSAKLMTPSRDEALSLPPPPENIIGASPVPFAPSGIVAYKDVPLSSSGVSTPTQGPLSPTPGSMPLPFSSPATSPTNTSASGGMDMFIPYQPEGPSPVSVAPTEPLRWLPPNASTSGSGTPVATPSPVKKHTNLFHYTGKASIPFAPRPGPVDVKKEIVGDGTGLSGSGAAGVVKKEEIVDPETPQK